MSSVKTILCVWAVLVVAGCSFEAPLGRFDQDQGADLGRGDLGVSDQGGEEDQGDRDLGDAEDLGGDQGQADQGEEPDQGVRDQGADSGAEEMGPGPQECGGVMVDVMTDEAHCGGCDRACDPKFGVCEGGVCGCTREGMEVCDGRCEDTQWDPNHCGGCGRSCGSAGACVRGECKCRPGYTVCNGRCVDLQSDPGNCGECGQSCGGKACKSGGCRGGDQCDIGWGRCGMQGGYACLQTMGNDLHCRGALDYGCGEVCEAGEVCERGGPFDPHRCRKIKLGRGCEACPCDECGDWGCEYAPGAVSRVWCVE